MSDDPLWIVKQEIAEREAFYSARVDELESKAAELRAELERTRKVHQDEMAELGNEHESKVREMKENNESVTNGLKSEFEERKDQIENHAFAEEMIIQDELDRESAAITQEIKECEETESQSQMQTQTEADSQLLSLRSIISEASQKYKALSTELVELTDKSLVSNKADKFRRGPKVTPLDRDIRRAEAAADDAKIQFQISKQKMDEQMQRTDELLKFQIKKMKREISSAVKRTEESKLRIAECNENHKITMASLRMEIIRLSNGPPPKLPSSAKLKAIKEQIAILTKSNTDMESQRDSLNEQYQEVLSTNRKLKQQVKRKQFNVGYAKPTREPRKTESLAGRDY